MFKINDLIRMSRPVMESATVRTVVETHTVARVTLPATADHPDADARPYAPLLGCGIPADASRMVPWAQPVPGDEITCKGCAGVGPRVDVLPGPAPEIDRVESPRGWMAGRKGKGARMHGIPDPDSFVMIEQSKGRGKNKITFKVPVWESACGESVFDWDTSGKEAPVPVAPEGTEGTVPSVAGPRTRYAPHMTDAGPGGVQWCNGCSATYKGLRGVQAPKGVLTSKAPENVGRHGERTDAQDRANTRAAWLGEVLPHMTLTLGAHGETIGSGSLAVVGKGGPVHAGYADAYGCMRLVCRTGVLPAAGWKEPKEGRESITCPGCRNTIFGEGETILKSIMDVIMRDESLSDLERFAPMDSGSGLSDYSAKVRGSWALTGESPVSPEALRMLGDTDSTARRFPFDRARGDFRTGVKATGDRAVYSADELAARKGDQIGLDAAKLKPWNKINFVVTSDLAPGGKGARTMIISKNIAERLGSVYTMPDGKRVTGWAYVGAMGALPGALKAILTREERARLYGGGKTLVARQSAARKARRERGAAAAGVVRSRTNRIDLREGFGGRTDTAKARAVSGIFGGGRDFSDREFSRVIGS